MVASGTAQTARKRRSAGVDIYTVPFNNGMGGKATPVAGASDPAHAEYYTRTTRATTS